LVFNKYINIKGEDMIMKRVIFAIISIMFFLSLGFLASAETIKLTWDANTEEDLAGYKVYSSRTNGGPYSLVSDVGNVIEYEINMTNESEGTIYYVATAYDLRGNESGYSNQASYNVDHTAPAPPTGCTIKLNW
jgi:hypothetical protein